MNTVMAFALAVCTTTTDGRGTNPAVVAIPARKPNVRLEMVFWRAFPRESRPGRSVLAAARFESRTTPQSSTLDRNMGISPAVSARARRDAPGTAHFDGSFAESGR